MTQHPEREGKRQLAAFVTVQRWRTLRKIATKTKRTQTDLITEALDDLAAKYGEGSETPKAKH
jgi:hypothetical protein